jgi:multicomponent Na+:H+ antiporter subunit E
VSIFLFLLWIVLNGKITLEIVIFGILIASLGSAFAWRVLGYSASLDLRIFKNLPLIILFIFNLIKEVFLAAVSVMKVALTGKKPDPVIVEFHSGFQSVVKNVLLANCITLTPGTYTLFQEGDCFVIHCLFGEYADGLEDSSFIRLIRRFK